MRTKGLTHCVAVLIGFLIFTTTSAARPTDANDESVTSRLDRIERAVIALETRQDDDELERVQRLADELREELERLREETRGQDEEENDEIRTVRRRLKVMRTAVDAYLEVDARDRAERVEQAMHARELAIAGKRGEEANRIRETAPDRQELAGLLSGAARLYRKWDMPDRAQALGDLAETYLQQWRRAQRAQREGRTEEREHAQESRNRLDDLATRMEIIRYARDAFAELGDEKNTKVLNGVLHYGELALDGVEGERLAEAAAAVPSKPNLVEYMSWAAHKYAEWGHEERAGACRELAEYYAAQLEGAREAEGEEHEVDHRREGAEGNIEELARRIEILKFAHAALAEAGKEEWAHTMARFVRVAEMQHAGVDGTEIAGAFEGLSMGMTIELLQKASGYYAEWGWEGRAVACHQLAEFYAARERGDGTALKVKEEAREPRNLEDRAHRTEILRLARAAHAEAGHLDAAELLERTIHLAELQMMEADDAAIARASEGLSMELITDLVRHAGELWAEWGHEGNAHRCFALVEFYVDREHGRAEAPRDETREREHGEMDEAQRRLVEMMHITEDLMHQAEELRRAVDELQQGLEHIRAMIGPLLDR